MTQTQNNYLEISNNSLIRVLHVDDDPFIRELSKQILREMGNFEIDQASCVDEALNKLKLYHYDVIISDYEMPQKDGIQFLKELRENKNEIPFILFTGKGREEVAIKALNLGADGYHNKQGEPGTVYGELFHSINLLMDRSKAKHALKESEKRYRTLMDKASEAIFVHNIKGQIVDVNQQACKNLGYTKQELLKMTIADIDNQAIQTGKDTVLWPKVMAGESFTFESIHKRKDGKTFPIELTLGPITIDNETFVMGLARDITERKNALGALLKSKELLAEAEKVGKIGGWEFDVNTLTQRWTDETFHILEIDMSHGEPKVPQGIEFINPPYRAMAEQAIQRAVAHGEPYDQEWEITTMQGNKRWVHAAGKANYENGKIKTISGSFQDITERKKVEEVLRESQRKYQDLIETTSDFIWEIDPQGHYTYCSLQMEKLWGLRPQEMLGKTPFDVMPPDIREKALESFMKIAKSTEPFKNLEMPSFDGEGRLIFIEISGVPFFDGQGKLVGYRGVTRDITERKKAGEAIQSLARFPLENLSGILRIDKKGTLLFANPPAKKLLLSKFEVGDFVNEPWRKFTFKAFESESRYAVEEKIGEQVFSLSFTPVISEGYVNVYCLDITERKKAEEEKNDLLHKLGERVKELDFVYGISKIFEKSNVTVKEAFPKVVQLLPSAMQYPDIACARLVADNHEFSTNNFKDTPRKLLSPIIVQGRKTGFVEVAYLEEKPTVGGGAFLNEERKLIDDVADRLGKVIERVRAEKALSVSEQRWVTTLESIGDAVIATDVEGRVTFLNKEAQKLTGWSLREASGKLLRDVFKIVNEQTRLVVEDPVAKVLKSGLIVGLANHTALLRKDGSEIPIDDSAAPIKDKNGDDTGVVLVFRDRTERKQTEEKLKETHNQIEAVNEKLHVVGSLTRHDVGNKLMAIKANVYLLNKQIGENPKCATYLEDIDSAIKASEKLFEFSRLYEKIGYEKPLKINVAECFNQAVALFSNLSSIKIVNECQELEVIADSLLRQLFYNFVDNSLKHGKSVSQITLHFHRDEKGVKLFYEDDGVGIPYEIKPKIFDVGFTTGKGKGFGLHLAKKIFEIYGWTITESGEIGKGAKFTITIPKLGMNNKMES